MSTKEPTKLKIGKNTYVIGNWSVDKSLETLVWLTKTFGEGFLSIFMSEDGQDAVKNLSGADESTTEDGEVKVKSAEDLEAEKKLIGEFAEKVINRLDAKEYVKYSQIIVKGTKCNGQDIDFNFHFVGRMGELHRLMFAILKHQYSDFLDAGGDDE